MQNINPEDLQETSTEQAATQETDTAMPEIITNYIGETISEVADTAKANIAEVVATNLAITAIKIITLILLFIVIRIALICVKFVTNLLANLPIISSINKIGGVAYGVIEGLFIIYLALAITMAISTITGNNDILIYINQSNLGKTMFNNNILLKIIFP